jgi:hypothetical protein
LWTWNSHCNTAPKVEEFRRRHRTGLVTLAFTDIVGSTLAMLASPKTPCQA